MKPKKSAHLHTSMHRSMPPRRTTTRKAAETKAQHRRANQNLLQTKRNAAILEGLHFVTGPMDFHEDPRWRAAMNDSLIANGTWTLIPLTQERSWSQPNRCSEPNRSWWNNRAAQGEARTVARGFQQWHGLDDQDTISPTVKWSTVRVFVTIATWKHWGLTHLDVKAAYLNGIHDTTPRFWSRRTRWISLQKKKGTV